MPYQRLFSINLFSAPAPSWGRILRCIAGGVPLGMGCAWMPFSQIKTKNKVKGIIDVVENASWLRGAGISWFRNHGVSTEVQLLCHFVCELIHYPDSLRACPSLLVVLMIGQLLCLLCASLSVIQILCVCACPSPFALPLALANALRYHVRYQEIMKLSSSLLLG